MPARESQKTGRLRLRHLMEHVEAVEEEMAVQRPRFERLASNDAKPRVVSSFNLFQTPEPLAERVVGMFATFGRVLEPSAGLGRLYRAVRAVDADCSVTLVELAADCCRELYLATTGDANCRLVQDDFLLCDQQRLGLFDSIAMNPPFKMGRDIKHIRHAATLLAPGGRLVSICANGPRQQRELKPSASQWIDLPPGSFKESYTNVNAAIVVIDA